ncbi:hypothetical protein [Mesorhizobium sp. WSM2239]|uniref:TMhelix containing protein n=2 Tax=unclassified Mesorhizobium TaxID=325217 RepID=A0AAU8D0Y1_9HYPH
MEKGVVINGRTIGIAVGLVALMSATFGGVAYVVRQDFRTTQIQTDHGEFRTKVENDFIALRVEMRHADDALALAQKESDRRTEQSYEKILQKFDALTAEVTKLTIALGNVQYKQDNGAAK